jgi:nucleoid DNA-binding protein
MPSTAAFYAAVASGANLKPKDVKRVFDEATGLIVKEMKLNGAFKVPGLVVLKTIKKKAREGGKRKCFGKECEVAARPASTALKVCAIKQLTDLILR